MATLGFDHQPAWQPGLPPLLDLLIAIRTSPLRAEVPASNPLISAVSLSTVSVLTATYRSQAMPEYQSECSAAGKRELSQHLIHRLGKLWSSSGQNCEQIPPPHEFVVVSRWGSYAGTTRRLYSWPVEPPQSRRAARYCALR